MKNLIIKGTPSEVLFKLKQLSIRFGGRNLTIKEILEVSNV